MTSPLTNLWLWFANRIWHWRVRQARRLFDGARSWEAMDALRIPGFGTDLIRVDFRPRIGAENHASLSWAPNPWIERPLEVSLPAARDLLARIIRHAPARSDWSETNAPVPGLPAWDNCFLTPVDMVALHGMIAEIQPRRYIEIGSGVSTQVVHYARQSAGIETEIISIDPAPRVEIESLCDCAFRTCLEDQVDLVQSLARPGDIIFFDGSHRSFPGSDVTCFFLDVLPRLPAGVIIHIHDIYLPADYPSPLWDRLWSEQYLLAAWLLGGGQGIDIILPCAALWDDEISRAMLVGLPTVADRQDSTATSSFWFRKT